MRYERKELKRSTKEFEKQLTWIHETASPSGVSSAKYDSGDVLSGVVGFANQDGHEEAKMLMMMQHKNKSKSVRKV